MEWRSKGRCDVGCVRRFGSSDCERARERDQGQAGLKESSRVPVQLGRAAVQQCDRAAGRFDAMRCSRAPCIVRLPRGKPAHPDNDNTHVARRLVERLIGSEEPAFPWARVRVVRCFRNGNGNGSGSMTCRRTTPLFAVRCKIGCKMQDETFARRPAARARTRTRFHDSTIPRFQDDRTIVSRA